MDALAARHLSTYGYSRPTAPALDRLANDGIVFTHAVAASCWTRPTIASLMTGRPVSDHRVEDRTTQLGAELTTLAEVFHGAGRPTAAFVANPVVRSEYGYDQGFDTYLDSDDLGQSTPATGVLRHATAWVRDHAREDFLLFVFLTDVHDPYRAPPTHAGMFTSAPGDYPLQPPPEVARPFEPAIAGRIVAAYDESIRATFDEIGELFETLREVGAWDRATVVVSADHGEMLGEHRSYRHLYQFWEPVLRIPLVVRSPAIAARGVVEPRLVSQVDLMPTILDVVGLQIPSEVRGHSLLPMWRDPLRGTNSSVVSEMSLFGVRRLAIRDDRYKVVVSHPVDAARFLALTGNPSTRLPRLPQGRVQVELYDLDADPDEETDLARGAVLPEPATRLLATVPDALHTPEADSAGRDEALLQDLRALGYAN